MGMANSYVERSIEPVLQQAARDFPAVVLIGPRQSGKATAAKHTFGKTHGYLSLEPPDVRASALSDPRGFLSRHRSPLILDEIQYAPELLYYIKEEIDSARNRKGRFILTGSQNLLLQQDVSESLAGRAAIHRLLPLSMRELRGHPDRLLPWDASPTLSDRSVSRKPVLPLWQRIIRGMFPEIAVDTTRDARSWHQSYVQTYLERDVRNVRQVGDLASFQSFVRALAARNGQLLNLSELSRDLGLAVNTLKTWLGVLEATFQVIRLQPYHANIGKRLIKSPRVYFTDTGTLCYLVGLDDPGHSESGPMGGSILESAVLSEIAKSYWHRGIEPRLYFWRTSAGDEVDLIVETPAGLVPIEIKLSSTPSARMASGINLFRELIGSRALRGYVVHGGEVTLPLGPGVTAIPFDHL